MLDKNQIKDWDGAPPSAQGFGEGVATGERVILTPEQVQARKRRGQWIALALFAFVIIVFVITMSKMGASIVVRDL